MGVKNQISIKIRGGPRYQGEHKDSKILEAQKYKTEDEAYKRKVEAKNALENYFYNIRRTIKSQKICATDKKNLGITLMKQAGVLLMSLIIK